MGVLESGYFFFVHKGEIVHSPRRLGGQARLSEWTGDESSGIGQERIEQSISSVHEVKGSSVVVDVGEMSDEQFQARLKKLH